MGPEKRESKVVKSNRRAKKGMKEDKKVKGPWKIKKIDVAVFLFY